jgi:hypothetical protein
MSSAMATWHEFEQEAPALAAAIGARFDAHKHKMLATLRRDGSPRISGLETTVHRGELWLGMMPGSRKSLDLQGDPRFALHSAPVDLDLVGGDAKVSGRAVAATPEEEADFVAFLTGEGTPPPPGEMDLYKADLTDASLVQVEGDHLVIDLWRSGATPSRQTRR